MKRSIEGRELIVLDGSDVVIRGTYHNAGKKGFRTRSNSVERDRVGVVFLNGWPATRAGRGDAAVYWADSFAERGYPSFRIDLPGFGDSDGEPPADWLRFINLGGYAPLVSGKIKEVMARFNLSGVVIAGHCAGAVSAVYAAAINKECRGLVLIDPYFYSAHTDRGEIRQQLSVWAERGRVAGILRSVFGCLRNMYLFFGRNVYPDHSNIPLLRCWKEVASTGLPILVLKVPGRKTSDINPRAGEFDYFRYIQRLAGRRSRVDVKSIDGANHSFSNRPGRTAVRRNTEEWLSANFPTTEPRVSETPELRQDPVIGQRLSKMPPATGRIDIPKKVGINANDCPV